MPASQVIAVAGLKMSNAERQSLQTRERSTQNIRSAQVSFGRFAAEHACEQLSGHKTAFVSHRHFRSFAARDHSEASPGQKRFKC